MHFSSKEDSAQQLATHGYFVLSIQHDLETDKPLPTTGNLFD